MKVLSFSSKDFWQAQIPASPHFEPSHCQSIQTIQTMLVFEGLTMTQPGEKSVFVCHRFLLPLHQKRSWCLSTTHTLNHVTSQWIMLDQENNDLHDPPCQWRPFCCEGIFQKKHKTKPAQESSACFLQKHLQGFTPGLPPKLKKTTTTPHLFRKISSTPALVISSARLLSFISAASRAHETKRCNLSKLAFCKPTVWRVFLILGSCKNFMSISGGSLKIGC